METNNTENREIDKSLAQVTEAIKRKIKLPKSRINITAGTAELKRITTE